MYWTVLKIEVKKWSCQYQISWTMGFSPGGEALKKWPS